jgi:DNA-binding beta-propeller fold protein YncE
VTYLKDDALIVIDTNVCNGSDPSGCATLSPATIHTGSDPQLVSLDPATQTLYTPSNFDNDVSVIDATRCDAQTRTGCRHLPPEVPISASGLAADPGVATIYAPGGANTVSMINTTQCNASHSGGCSQTPPTIVVGAFPDAAAVDPVTHTTYVADGGSGSTGSVSLFDDRACNATRQAGCGNVSTLPVPDGNPVDIAVNPLTDTLYVATLTSNGGPDLISVFDGATCNATNTTGCDQTPANVQTGSDGGGPFSSTEAVAVNPATNTIYATSDTLGNPFLSDTVYMIDGTACDATNTTGCDKAPATISVGSDPFFGDANPFAIAVDQRTDTIYTANIRNGEALGTVSVINGATCSSQNTSGCGQTPATAPAGFGTAGIAVDEHTNRVYATNTEDASVTTINGNSCNGTHAHGCAKALTRAIVGDYPGSIALDPHVRTAYVQAFEGVSVIPLNH